MRALVVVAVGGGGDAITSAILGRILGQRGPLTVLTYSWDRLLVDPLPGPRQAADFAGLTELAPHVLQVTAETAALLPAGSSLPRLAAEMPARFILLDPTHGAVGMAEQITATLDHFEANRVIALDVGGDALTNGHDPGLRSPLADQLAMAACLRTGLPTSLLIAAPGIDGELSVNTLDHRLDVAGASILGRITPADASALRSVLQWHPSEASGLLAAAAIGMRGTVEVRDAADQVQLTDRTVLVHQIQLQAIADQSPATSLVDTQSLNEADEAITAATGVSELRYETAKATTRSRRPAHTPTAADLARIDALAAESNERGADFISMRRLAELIGATNLRAYAELTELLAQRRPDRYAIGAYCVQHSRPRTRLC